MGYGYVLGINDLRELKEMRNGEQNVPLSSLYKKNYNHGGDADLYQMNYDDSNMKNILMKNSKHGTVRKASSNNNN